MPSGLSSGVAGQRALFGWGICGALLAAAPALRAETAPAPSASEQGSEEADTRPVEERFAEARQLFLDEKCRQALPMFERLYAETKSSNALLYVARCERAEGAWDAAYASLKQTIARAEEQAAEDPKYEGTRDAAKSELDQVAPHVALVTVVLTTDTPGVRVRVGGRELAAEEIGTAVAVLPGRLQIEATPPKGSVARREVEVGAGASRTVALSLTEASAVPAAPVAQDSGRTLRYAGIGSLALGAAGMGAFALFGSLAQSRFDELEQDCGGRCPEDRQADVDSGRTLQTVANVSLVVGVVGLASGATLVVLGWPKDEDTRQVSLRVGPAAVSLAGAF